MDISEKTSNYIELGTAAGLGFLAFVNQATAKYAGDYPALGATAPWSTIRIEDAIAGIIGPNAVGQLDPSYVGKRNDVVQKNPAPFNALNTTTFTGAAVLITDYALRKILPNKYYKNLPVIPEVMRGAGIGITIGGILGGIFDDPRPGFTATQPVPIAAGQVSGGIATGNVPFSRAGTLYQGSALN